MEKKVKHLEMIQAVINRMAGNSFMLKGWAVTLAAGVFALSGKDTNKQFFLVAYIPILMFWGLDSYYLLQERLYRVLFEKVQKIDEDDIDFTLKISSKKCGEIIANYIRCVFSITEITFYMPLALLCAAIVMISTV